MRKRWAIAEAEQLVAEIDGAYMPKQFDNPANPLMHYRTTGPEIWNDTDGRVDVFIPGTLDVSMIDETIQVESKGAIETAKQLSKEECLRVCPTEAISMKKLRLNSCFPKRTQRNGKL